MTAYATGTHAGVCGTAHMLTLHDIVQEKQTPEAQDWQLKHTQQRHREWLSALQMADRGAQHNSLWGHGADGQEPPKARDQRTGSLWRSMEAVGGLCRTARCSSRLETFVSMAGTDSPFPAGAWPCTVSAALPAASEPEVGPAPPSPGAAGPPWSLRWGNSH